MSVRVMNKGAVEGPGFVHGMSCMSMMESPEMCNIGDRGFSVQEKMVAKEKREDKKVMNICTSSSSTSSIGKNSDLSSGKSLENSSDNDEVQSPYKGPLDAMEALEEVLPIRRGISRFYNGKSKSFASLVGASSSSSSIKDLAKPENAYTRRRRNLLASNLASDKNKNSPLKSNGGGVSKKVTTTNRTTALALAVTMSSNSESNNTNNILSDSLTPDLNGSTIAALPILRSRLNPKLSSPRHNFPAWRSYSLADLQQCVPIRAATALDMKPSQT